MFCPVYARRRYVGFQKTDLTFLPHFHYYAGMNPRNRLPSTLMTEPVRRVDAGAWAIELLPASAYATRYVASQAAIGFAFDSQRGVHAIGSDRVRPFLATPNGLAFVPTGCDVLSESSQGGEYLRVVRTDGLELPGDHAFNNRIDPQAIRLALRMRNAMLHATVDDDWQAWALALAERATAHFASPAQPTGSLTANRLRLLTALREGAQRLHTLFADLDLLLTPAAPAVAPRAGDAVHDAHPQAAALRASGNWLAATPFSHPFNLTQQPALALPWASNAQGLPLGLQVVGRRHADALVLDFGAALEQWLQEETP